MFDISGPELLTILVIALIVVGPRRLPELTRRLGSWTNEIRQAVRDLRTGLDKDVKALTEPLEQAKEDLDQVKEDLAQPLRDVQDDLETAAEEASEELDGSAPESRSKGYEWVGPKPVSGPTPEDAMNDLSELESKQESEEEAS